MLESDGVQDTGGENLNTRVRPAAGRCLDVFASAIEASSSRHTHRNQATPDLSLLVVERDRFRVWAANAAAFANGRSSLDYRLRQLPEELDLVKSLVNTIYSQLQSYVSAIKRAEETAAVDRSSPSATLEASDTISSPPHSGTEDEASVVLSKLKTDTSHYVDALESIHTSIDWLHRLSNLLRKASVVNQNLHAQSCKLPGMDFEGLVDCYAWLVARDFPGLSEQLKSRMSRAMAERHRRILYRRQRYGLGWQQQEEFHYGDQFATPEKAAETVLLSKDDQSLDADALKRQESVESLKAGEAPSLSLKGATTEPDPSRYNTRSTVSTARSAALNHNAEMLLPPAPRKCQTESSFTCEFCCMILPSETGKSRVLWS